MLDEPVPAAALRQRVLDRIGKGPLRKAAAAVRRFLPALLASVAFERTLAAKLLLNAWRFLQILPSVELAALCWK